MSFFSVHDRQFLLLVGEMVTLYTILLLFYWMRRYLGLALLYFAIGAMQSLQHVLGAVVTVKLYFDLQINPASAVLFPAGLSIILLLYAKKSAIEWRRLCIVILWVNLFLILTVSLFAWRQLALSKMLTPELALVFPGHAVLTVVGSLLLVVDIWIAMFMYDLFRVRGIFLRLAIPLYTALLFDSFIYTAVATDLGADFWPSFYAHATTKLCATVVYCLLLALYLRGFEREMTLDIPTAAGSRDFLTYLVPPGDYDSLRSKLILDPVTSLYNRVFLVQELAQVMAAAERSGKCALFLGIRVPSSEDPPNGGKNWLETIRRVCEGHHRGLVCKYTDDALVVLLANATEQTATSIQKEIAQEFELAGKHIRNDNIHSYTYNPLGKTGSWRRPSVRKIVREVLRNGDHVSANRKNKGQSATSQLHETSSASSVAEMSPDPRQEHLDDGTQIRHLEASPIMQEAQKAFLGAYEELLRKHPGRWIAYRGNERIGVFKRQADIYAFCSEKEIPFHDVLALLVEEGIDLAKNDECINSGSSQ